MFHVFLGPYNSPVPSLLGTSSWRLKENCCLVWWQWTALNLGPPKRDFILSYKLSWNIWDGWQMVSISAESRNRLNPRRLVEWAARLCAGNFSSEKWKHLIAVRCFRVPSRHIWTSKQGFPSLKLSFGTTSPEVNVQGNCFPYTNEHVQRNQIQAYTHTNTKIPWSSVTSRNFKRLAGPSF